MGNLLYAYEEGDNDNEEIERGEKEHTEDNSRDNATKETVSNSHSITGDNNAMDSDNSNKSKQGT